MMPNRKSRTSLAIPTILLAAILAACDSSSNPMAPEVEDPASALPTVVVGQISLSTQGQATGAARTSGDDLSGVLVTIDGTSVADTTDSSGTFRLEAVSTDGTIVLRFRRGSLDARLKLEGVGRGTLIRVEVTLDDESVSLSDSSRGDHGEFEGKAAFISLSGNAPQRILRVEVADTAGAVMVDIIEGVTTFDNEGDLLSFADALAALQAGRSVEIEGEGTRQADGSVDAAQVKAETDDHDDDDGKNDDGRYEFDGGASFVSLTGTAPSRALRVEVADTTGAVSVDITEGVTTFDNEGDILSFGDVLAALQAGTAIRIEGEGTRQGDGSIAAAEVKVETDD